MIATRPGSAGALCRSHLRVFGIICDIAAEGRPVTIRGVMRRMGPYGFNSMVCAVKALRTAGLVTWEPGRAATLRPLVRFIPAEEL